MGLVYARLSLANSRDSDIEPIQVNALVDTGSIHLCIPAQIAERLNLHRLDERKATTADGTESLVPYVGPVTVRFNSRGCYVGALVMGDEVLLGAVPMEDMDLVVHPATLTIGPNPKSPDTPAAIVK
jgi:clan AA aspartic protease